MNKTRVKVAESFVSTILTPVLSRLAFRGRERAERVGSALRGFAVDGSAIYDSLEHAIRHVLLRLVLVERASRLTRIADKFTHLR